MKQLLLIPLLSFFIICHEACTNAKKTEEIVVDDDTAAAQKLLNDSSKAMLIIKKDTLLSRFKVYGTNWFNNMSGSFPVRFVLNNQPLSDFTIQYFVDSSFLMELPPLYGVRSYTLTASQQKDGGEKKIAKIHFRSISGDKE
jgi:hypothetical protein